MLQHPAREKISERMLSLSTVENKRSIIKRNTGTNIGGIFESEQLSAQKEQQELRGRIRCGTCRVLYGQGTLCPCGQ
jgi:hypothetical protein